MTAENSTTDHDPISHAMEIVNANEWSGDTRVNMTTVIGAGRVLARRVEELELIIVRARQASRKSRDPVDSRAWLFRTKIDESKYPE